MKSWIEKNHAIEMNSAHKERKSIAAERLIRTLEE